MGNASTGEGDGRGAEPDAGGCALWPDWSVGDGRLVLLNEAQG